MEPGARRGAGAAPRRGTLGGAPFRGLKPHGYLRSIATRWLTASMRRAGGRGAGA